MALENFQTELEGNQVDYTTKPKPYNKNGKETININFSQHCSCCDNETHRRTTKAMKRVSIVRVVNGLMCSIVTTE